MAYNTPINMPVKEGHTADPSFTGSLASGSAAPSLSAVPTPAPASCRVAAAGCRVVACCRAFSASGSCPATSEVAMLQDLQRRHCIGASTEASAPKPSSGYVPWEPLSSTVSEFSAAAIHRAARCPQSPCPRARQASSSEARRWRPYQSAARAINCGDSLSITQMKKSMGTNDKTCAVIRVWRTINVGSICVLIGTTQTCKVQPPTRVFSLSVGALLGD